MWGDGSVLVAAGWETILRSPDGGVTWTRVASPTDIGLYDIWGEGSMFVAVGSSLETYPPSAVVFRSTDAGLTWRRQTNASFVPAGSSLEAVAGIGSVLVTAGGWGTIMRSTNGGATWEIVQGVQDMARVMDFAGLGSTLVAVGDSMIWVSTDLGLTWSGQPPVSNHPLMGVWMPDEHTVLAGGQGVIVRGRR